MASRIFSDKYVPPNVNAVQLLLYRLAYPLAVLLNRLHLSPNQITTLSLATSVLAFIALACDEGWGWFAIFWGITVSLDFCDGTVARMTGRISKAAFRYDHMSDLFKIFLLFPGTGIRYDDSLVWIVSTSVLFLYMYFTVLNHELNHVRKFAAKFNPPPAADIARMQNPPVAGPHSRFRERYRVVGWLARYDWPLRFVHWLWNASHDGWRATRTMLLTINGHTLLLFFVLPLGAPFATGGLCYFGLVALVGIRERITELLATQRP